MTKGVLSNTVNYQIANRDGTLSLYKACRSHKRHLSRCFFLNYYTMQLFERPANSRELLLESFLVGTLGSSERSGTNAERH